MKPADSSSGWAQALPVQVAFALGALGGVAALLVALAETRWQVYGVGALAFFCMLPLVRNRERALWITFVAAFQVNVSLRLLFGYSNSEGLVFPFAFVVGLAWFILSGKIWSVRSFTWGSAFAGPIALIFATGFVSVVFSTEQFIGAAALLRQCQLYFMFLVALNCVTTEERFRLTVNTLLVVLLLQAAVYYVQSGLGITFSLTGEVFDEGTLPRPGGTVASNPSGYASFILPILMIAVAFFIARQTGRGKRALAGAGAALGAGAIVLTLTRASWGAFVIGVAVLMVAAARRRILSPSRFAVVLIVASIAALAAAPMIAARLSGAPMSSSMEERVDLMRMAAVVISQNPVTGVGLGAYDHTYRSFLSGGLQDKWQFTVHNYYLLRTAETGLLGGLAFIMFLVVAYRQAVSLSNSPIEDLRIPAMGFAAGILALCFEILWDTSTGFPHHALLWFLCGLMVAGHRIEAQQVLDGEAAVS